MIEFLRKFENRSIKFIVNSILITKSINYYLQLFTLILYGFWSFGILGNFQCSDNLQRSLWLKHYIIWILIIYLHKRSDRLVCIFIAVLLMPGLCDSLHALYNLGANCGRRIMIFLLQYIMRECFLLHLRDEKIGGNKYSLKLQNIYLMIYCLFQLRQYLSDGILSVSTQAIFI